MCSSLANHLLGTDGKISGCLAKTGKRQWELQTALGSPFLKRVQASVMRGCGLAVSSLTVAIGGQGRP